MQRRRVKFQVFDLEPTIHDYLNCDPGIIVKDESTIERISVAWATSLELSIDTFMISNIVRQVLEAETLANWRTGGKNAQRVPGNTLDIGEHRLWMC